MIKATGTPVGEDIGWVLGEMPFAVAFLGWRRLGCGGR